MDTVLVYVNSLTVSDWIGVGVGVAIAAAVVLIGTILRTRRRDAGRVDLGAALDSDPFAQGSSSERRIAPRRRGNPVSVRVSDGAAQVAPVRGWVVDRSASGLGLELEEEGDVEIGTILSVRPAEAANVPWIRIEVRNRQKTGSTWRLGCKFLKPPAWDVLMRFG